MQHQNEPRDATVTWLPPESEHGNVEYKLRLRDPSTARLEQLVCTAQTPTPHTGCQPVL